MSNDTAGNHHYDESKIKTLSSLEHIRARPGMYIGRLGNGSHPDDGIYILIKEIIDNAIDEFIMGHGRKVDISLTETDSVTVRDYGRGIPLGKLVECVSVINTGAKYNSDVFQFSVGLNGVGTKAVNALSSRFRARACRDGKFRDITFTNGELSEDQSGKTNEPNGTLVEFEPDGEFFSEYSFKEKYIRRRLWNYAYLNSGLALHFNGERFYSKNGLLDLLSEKVNSDSAYDVIHYKSQELEFSICHTDNFGETYFSFVNGQYTNDGGTHLSAFREGILKGINEFAQKNFNGDDVRNGIVGAVAVKLKEPIFESQTKNKLGNSEIRGEIVSKVKEVISAYLYQHKDVSEIILEKISRNEKIRKEVQAVRKQAKEKAKRTALKIPKLRDCKYHLGHKSGKGEDTMVFLTEGQSASGSIISCRDVYTQAVFSLRGKPMNCHGHKIETVYKNEELYFIMKALGIEDGIENLRYQKIIIATDADVDGLHIRNLILTYFLTFFEQLILSGHVYILETPLFRVRNKKQTFYAYDESERNQYIKQLKGNAEVTRFKGLGEISPKEFAQFIGNDMRVLPVTVENMHFVPELLNFFMGKNTPDRKQYIMGHLV